MDVQVVAGAAAPQQQAPAVVPGQPNGGIAPASSPQPPGQLQPPLSATPGDPQQASQGALSDVAAQIFGGKSESAHPSVSVSYRIENDPHTVVMVFTDPATGQEITQVPSEVMVQLAAFFDKHSGVTLDKSA